MLPSDSPSLYRLSYRGSDLILRGPPDTPDLRVLGRGQPQLRLPYEWEVANRNYIGPRVIGAKDPQGSVYRMTFAIASATGSTFLELSAATQRRPVSIA